MAMNCNKRYFSNYSLSPIVYLISYFGRNRAVENNKGKCLVTDDHQLLSFYFAAFEWNEPYDIGAFDMEMHFYQAPIANQFPTQ